MGAALVGTKDALRPTPWTTLTHTHSLHCHFPCPARPRRPRRPKRGPSSLERVPAVPLEASPASCPQWSASLKVHRSFFPSRPVLLTQIPYSPISSPSSSISPSPTSPTANVPGRRRARDNLTHHDLNRRARPDDSRVLLQLHVRPRLSDDAFPPESAPPRPSQGWRRGADRALARDFTTMTTTTTPEGGPNPGALNATQRARWATRRMTVRSSSNKRNSLMNRMHKKTGSNEKNPPLPEGSEPPAEDALQPPVDSGDQEENEDVEEASGTRALYFNQPLPDSLVDEEGHPIQEFTRNKIRTAKYTPLSFVPKNLWFQFHNVANIFFLFLVILVVSSYSPRVSSVVSKP